MSSIEFQCAGIHKIDYTQIDTCVGSDEGNLLEHQVCLFHTNMYETVILSQINDHYVTELRLVCMLCWKCAK